MTAIREIEVIHISLPTRREHKWTGLTEPIGRYVLVKATDDEGRVGWGEAPALKDWGGEFGRYFGESPLIARTVIDHHRGQAQRGHFGQDWRQGGCTVECRDQDPRIKTARQLVCARRKRCDARSSAGQIAARMASAITPATGETWPAKAYSAKSAPTSR